MDDNYYIPKEEHPFEIAAIDNGRLVCRLWHRDYGGDGWTGHFLEIGVSGKLERVIVESGFDMARPNHRTPEEDEEFAIYGLNVVGQLFKRYLPRMLADSF